MNDWRNGGTRETKRILITVECLSFVHFDFCRTTIIASHLKWTRSDYSLVKALHQYKVLLFDSDSTRGGVAKNPIMIKD